MATIKEMDDWLDEHGDELNDVICALEADRAVKAGVLSEGEKEQYANWLKQELDAGRLVFDCEVTDPSQATDDTRCRLIDPTKPVPPWHSEH